jgi:hypothetical protein
MIDWAREHKRCQIWAGMGSGKTSAMEFLIALLKLTEDAFNEPVLVIGPMRVARDTWPEDMARWEQFKDLRIMPLVGTPTERKDKLRCLADIFTLSYNLAPWLVEHYMEKWPYRVVIADESDNLASFREKRGGVGLNTKKAARAGVRAHSLGMIAHNMTDRWINLTGTPSANGLQALWGPQWYIDRGAALGRTRTAFVQRWFKPKWSGYGIEPMPHSEAQIHAALYDTCITIDPKDYYDIKEPLVRQIKVKLPAAARKIYQALEKELFAELEDGVEVEVLNEAALSNKCLQIANGAIYTDYPTWVAVHDEKLEALRSIASESGGMPLLVAYSFKSDVERIKRAFPRAVELRTNDGMRAFKSGNAPMGLAHPASMGHGIDGLQNITNVLVRFGQGWNRGQRMQMLERIGPMRQLQAGLDRPVWVYDIVCENSIDEAVIDAHANSRTVQDALLLAMKRRK